MKPLDSIWNSVEHSPLRTNFLSQLIGTQGAFGIMDMSEPHACIFNLVLTLGNVTFYYTTGSCTLLL